VPEDIIKKQKVTNVKLAPLIPNVGGIGALKYYEMPAELIILYR
jgi:hypothetical protein